MMGWLLEIAATLSFIGLAVLGAAVVWIQVQGWLEAQGLAAALERAERRMSRLHVDAVGEMFDRATEPPRATEGEDS